MQLAALEIVSMELRCADDATLVDAAARRRYGRPSDRSGAGNGRPLGECAVPSAKMFHANRRRISREFPVHWFLSSTAARVSLIVLERFSKSLS